MTLAGLFVVRDWFIDGSSELHPIMDQGSQGSATERRDVNLVAEMDYMTFYYPDIGWEILGEWVRGEADLPVFQAVGVIRVRNKGSRTATNVILEVVARAGERAHTLHQFNLDIGAFSSYRREVPISFRYNDSHGVYLHIRCDDNDPFEVKAYKYFKVPWIRVNPYVWPDLVKLYITPENPSIVALDVAILEAGWLGVFEWIGDSIAYCSDPFWSLGHETIERGSGSSCDVAVLACSLLRCRGWDPDEVYVGVWGGNVCTVFSDTGGSGWVRVLFTGECFISEAFVDRDSAVAGADVLFNDAVFLSGSR